MVHYNALNDIIKTIKKIIEILKKIVANNNHSCNNKDAKGKRRKGEKTHEDN